MRISGDSMNKENQDITKSLLDVDLDAIVEAGQKKETKQKKKKRYIIGIGGVLCLVVVLALLYVKVIVPTSQYNDAVELVKQGNYQAAIDGFEALGDYKNSADMVFDTKYKWAEKLLADKAYDEAYDKFKEIESYSDAANRMNDVRYAEAEGCLESKDFEKAIELFETLGDYNDAQTRVKEANYLWAEESFEQGQLEEALTYFNAAGNYRDAESRAAEVYEMMQIHATAVTLNKTSLSISKDKTAKLSVTMEPADTTDTIVGWTSSDEKVATVDEDGVVTAVGSGTATIEVETSNGLTAMCKVTVPKPSAAMSTDKSGGTNGGNTHSVVYGTSTNRPDTAVPLTKSALLGLWRCATPSGEVGFYWLKFDSDGNFYRRRQCSYDAAWHATDAPFHYEDYQDNGTYSLNGTNLTVTYQRKSEENPDQMTGWITETWPIAYVHPNGIRFDCIVSQAQSFYRIS